MAELFPDLKDRPVQETICLFDVDGTLTPARQTVSAEMLKLLSDVRHKCAIGFVSQY
jgi:phosphomannomutase